MIAAGFANVVLEPHGVAEGEAVAVGLGVGGTVALGDGVAPGVGVGVGVAGGVGVGVAGGVVGVGVGVKAPATPLMATVMRSLGETAPVSVSKTCPKATAEVRLTSGVAVMVSNCVCWTLPVKLKLHAVTLTVKTGVMA